MKKQTMTRMEITIGTTKHCMKNIQKSVLIWYSCEEMFSLVTDVARYPDF